MQEIPSQHESSRLSPEETPIPRVDAYTHFVRQQWSGANRVQRAQMIEGFEKLYGERTDAQPQFFEMGDIAFRSLLARFMDPAFDERPEQDRWRTMKEIVALHWYLSLSHLTNDPKPNLPDVFLRPTVIEPVKRILEHPSLDNTQRLFALCDRMRKKRFWHALTPRERAYVLDSLSLVYQKASRHEKWVINAVDARNEMGFWYQNTEDPWKDFQAQIDYLQNYWRAISNNKERLEARIGELLAMHDAIAGRHLTEILTK